MAQKLSNLANKSKVKFGSLYGSPIIWIVADKNHAGYPSNSVTLVTNQIIKMLCFDATEPSNGNSDRRNYGNNRYIYSNLRQWLNSPAAAGQWYTAQHSADQTPDSSHVWNSVNPYSGLAGFLNAFTANERAALLNTTITVGKSSTDGGGTETCTDKIFPLSCTEVGLSGDHVCGSKLAIFSDNNSRIATVTASCVANSNYSSNPGSGAAWYYWLRDAYADLAYFARCVSAEVRDKLAAEMKWYDDYLAEGGVDRDANPTPGNKKGGLANIVEKAMGSIAKSGTSPIVEVLSPAEKPSKHGLIFAATPASDIVCGPSQVASGIGLQVFMTGRGTPYGLDVAPVIKVCSRNEMKEQWFDLIDISAGHIATGEATIADVGTEIFNLILDVASGTKQPYSDQYGFHNDMCIFNPAPIT